MKDVLSTAFRAAEIITLDAAIEKTKRRIAKLLASAVRSTCPVREGDIFRVTVPMTGKRAYFHAHGVRGEIHKVKGQPAVVRYVIAGRRCLADGTPRPGSVFGITAEWQPTVVQRRARA